MTWNARELELQAYRQTVVAEMERRVLVLQEIDRRIVKAQYGFEQAAGSARVQVGTTARKQIENAHRMRLRDVVKGLEKERLEAKADLERAEARLKEVDQKLDELAKERQEA